MTKTIFFDMDGTIANLYAINNWLTYLRAEDTYPYENAEVMLNMNLLARYLNKVQKRGYSIGIISWTSKNSSNDYHNAVIRAKEKWLKKHLASVKWDVVKIVKYGTNKYNECGGGILFDDEERNRNDWKDESYTPDMILDVLKNL